MSQYEAMVVFNKKNLMMKENTGRERYTEIQIKTERETHRER